MTEREQDEIGKRSEIPLAMLTEINNKILNLENMIRTLQDPNRPVPTTPEAEGKDLLETAGDALFPKAAQQPLLPSDIKKMANDAVRFSTDQILAYSKGKLESGALEDFWKKLNEWKKKIQAQQKKPEQKDEPSKEQPEEQPEEQPGEQPQTTPE